MLENPVYIAMLAVLAYGLGLLFINRMSNSKLEYMVANRQVPMHVMAIVTAAAYIWSVGFVVGPQMAFNMGWVGLFWFCLANGFSIFFFAWFIKILRDKFPDGFTLAGCMGERYSPRVQNLYIVQTVIVAVTIYATHLLTGAVILGPLTGFSSFQVMGFLIVVSLCYSMMGGIRGSILNNLFKYFVIVLTLFVGLYMVLSSSGSFNFDMISNGVYGKSGTYTSLFTEPGLTVFWTIGLLVTINLLAGPIGMQPWYQQGFAVEKTKVRQTFIVGAVIFIAIPIALGLFGFIAASSLPEANPQNIIAEVIKVYSPNWVFVLYMFVLLLILTSMLDLFAEALSNVTGHDLYNKFKPEGISDVMFARMAFPVFALIALGIASVPGMTVLYMFLLYGTMRVATFVPTIITIVASNPNKGDYYVSERGMFWGIILAFLGGMPIFLLGNFAGATYKWMLPFGSISMIVLSFVIVMAFTIYERRQIQPRQLLLEDK